MSTTLRSISTRGLRLAALGAATLLAGRTAHAQWGRVSQQQGSQLLFEWQGRVDRETQLVIGRNNVSAHGVNSNESRGRFSSRRELPRGAGTLYVQRIDGRGQVDVIQQPGNGYGDGVIRIRDTQGGADTYAVRVYWQPSGNVVADRDRDRDRRDRDGDGRYDDDRADRRADKAERQAEKAREKAQKAREKANRKDRRDDGRGDRRW